MTQCNCNKNNKVELPENQNKYNGMVILLDNGHASSTPGKRSPEFPDGYILREYEFNREIVRKIAMQLDNIGIKYHIIVPEIDEDISLSERVKRVNKYCEDYGTNNCLLISVHANAAGNGEWKNARGWSVYTSKGQTKSDDYATIFFKHANEWLPIFDMTLRSDYSDRRPRP